ncbi:hypothetical protein ANCDUO_20471 [Ancylostoma duodenale]|nr:hypothetical protein ANCDUO_20471 [Ancylostoma duodenale]
MTSLGLERVMKIPLTKLKKLKSITNKPQTQSLAERLSTIEFCEGLIRQRAELLKEFEERLQVLGCCQQFSDSISCWINR